MFCCLKSTTQYADAHLWKLLWKNFTLSLKFIVTVSKAQRCDTNVRVIWNGDNFSNVSLQLVTYIFAHKNNKNKNEKKVTFYSMQCSSTDLNKTKHAFHLSKLIFFVQMKQINNTCDIHFGFYTTHDVTRIKKNAITANWNGKWRYLSREWAEVSNKRKHNNFYNYNNQERDVICSSVEFRYGEQGKRKNKNQQNSKSFALKVFQVSGTVQKFGMHVLVTWKFSGCFWCEK